MSLLRTTFGPLIPNLTVVRDKKSGRVKLIKLKCKRCGKALSTFHNCTEKDGVIEINTFALFLRSGQSISHICNPLLDRRLKLIFRIQKFSYNIADLYSPLDNYRIETEYHTK